MNTKERVPKSFKLFGSTINVVWNNKRLNDKEAYGFSNYSTDQIMLSTHDHGEELSEGRVLDTFYHERTHQILDAMGERELSSNEKFVDVFSKLQRQADETAEY